MFNYNFFEYEYFIYKYINSNSDLYNNILQDMKEKYKLTTSDRINNALNSIGMLQSLIDVLK